MGKQKRKGRPPAKFDDLRLKIRWVPGMPVGGAATPGPIGLGRELSSRNLGLGELKFPGEHLVTWSPSAFRAYTDFKNRVLEGQRDWHRRRKVIYKDTLPKEELGEIEPGSKGKHILLKDAAAKCRALLEHARKEAPAGITIGVASAYRTVEKEQELWHSYFEKYYQATSLDRSLMRGGEHGHTAVEYMVAYVRKRKAAPGYSNHSAGIAVDFSTTIPGKKGPVTLGASMSQNEMWKRSWFHSWLSGAKNANANKYGFRPIDTEAWHWEHRP